MRAIVLSSLSFGLALASGCSMCSPGFLDDYATVGGKWQRSDPSQGRVGSIFSDPGSTIAAGAVGTRVVDSHPAGVESEVFGEAHTEAYPDQYPSSGEEFYELNGTMDDPEFVPEVYEGTVDDAQIGNGSLRLGDEW